MPTAFDRKATSCPRFDLLHYFVYSINSSTSLMRQFFTFWVLGTWLRGILTSFFTSTDIRQLHVGSPLCPHNRFGNWGLTLLLQARGAYSGSAILARWWHFDENTGLYKFMYGSPIPNVLLTQHITERLYLGTSHILLWQWLLNLAQAMIDQFQSWNISLYINMSSDPIFCYVLLSTIIVIVSPKK